MVQGDVPCALTAHGKSAQQDAVRIDLVPLLHRGHRFPHVSLAREVPSARVPAAVDRELDLAVVGYGRVADALVWESEEEFRFGSSRLTAVHPDVEAHRLRAIVGFRQRHTVW